MARYSNLRATTSGPSLEPPEPPPECLHCEGNCQVLVKEYIDTSAVVHHGTWWLDCPHCKDNPGVEPALDPRDDPALDDRVKERRHGGG